MTGAAFLFVLGLLYMPVAIAAEPPASVHLYNSHTQLEADGRAVQTLRIDIAVRNDAAARAEAQQPMIFSEGVESVELVEGFTIKPDGRRIPVEPGAVRAQSMPAAPGMTQFDTRRRVVAILPDAAGGDVLSVTWRRTILRPILPGQFLQTILFSPRIPWDNAEVTLRMPQNLFLNTESFGPAHSVASEDGSTIHRWRWSAPSAPDRPRVLADLDAAPRIFASTFRDWPAFSSAYADLFVPRAGVTPAIQSLADEVVAGAANRREEAQRLADWVARRIRWVAVYVENGAFVPRRAEDVLRAGWGDCKDQVALLIALLSARGIEAEPVLVHQGATYRLSGPPTLTAFNHAITFLPEWGLYTDTTAGGAPLGVFQANTYGKPALHLTTAGDAPRRIQALPLGLASARLRTVLRMDSDGALEGESVTDAAGPYALVLRGAGARSMARGSEADAAERLRGLQQAGTGEVMPAPLEPVGDTYRITGRFRLEPRPGMIEGDSFVLPTGLRFLPRPGEGLLGPLTRGVGADQPAPCYAGRQEEDLTLELPVELRPLRLPRGREIRHELFDYSSQWSLEGSTLRVQRVFEGRFTEQVCEGELRAAAARALEDVRRDHEVRIELEPRP
jgi:hypothetical protein